MKTKFYFKFLSILTLTILTFFACETEPFGGNELTEQQLTTKELFKVNYSLEDFEDESGHIVNNIEVDWDNYKTKIFQENEWYEFQINQKKPMSYMGNGEIRGQSFTLLAHQDGNGYKFYINKMLSFHNDNEFTYFGLREKFFGGMVYLYNLEGEVEHLVHYEKGKPMHSVESIKVNPETIDSLGLVSRGDCHERGNTARCDDALSCGIDVSGGASSNGSCGGGGTGGGTGWTPVTTYHFTDWYNNNGNNWSYNGTTYDGYTTEWVWIPGGYNPPQTSWTYATTTGGGSSLDGYSSGNTTYSDNPPPNDTNEDEKTIPVVQQTLTQICGDYRWNLDQYSATVNITNVYVQALRPTKSGVHSIDVKFDVLCVDIPYQSTSRNASITFNAAYERAKRNLMNWLTNNPSINDDFIATEQFKVFLLRSLRTSQPGSTLSTNPCAGSSTSEAKYCV